MKNDVTALQLTSTSTKFKRNNKCKLSKNVNSLVNYFERNGRKLQLYTLFEIIVSLVLVVKLVQRFPLSSVDVKYLTPVGC